MLSYCLKYRRTSESKKLKIVKMKNGRIMLSPNCAMCGIKKSRFIIEQEASGSLSNLGVKAPFSQILFLGPILL